MASPAIFVNAEREFAKPEPPPNRQWVADAELALARGDRPAPPVVPQRPAFSVAALTNLLTVSHLELRRKLYQVFKHPDFHYIPGESLPHERARVMRMWRHVAGQHLIENSISAGTPEGRARYDAVIDSCGLVSHSLDIKMSVHYGLFGSTVMLMGDDAQARRWVPLIERCEMLGCFALTELGHGSNARGIETVATYDASARQFVIHTPHEAAQKYWIGGAGTTARWAVVFAQLELRGVQYGIHPFLVRVRQDNGDAVPGVQLADCGHKPGMNGVDNGRLWFTHVRVPHEQFLRRHSQVSLDGTYTTRFRTADERFGASMTSLSGGRISVAAGALNQAKVGLTIAVRYALQRRAFGPVGNETRLIDYPSHQLRLIPLVATTIVMQIVNNKLRLRWHNQQLGKTLHTWSSGFKALMSWHALNALQEAREACGGQGYKSENLLAPLRASHDVALTYEGDNHILLQAVVKTVLPDFVRGVRKGNVFEGHFAYLNSKETLGSAAVENVSARSTDFARAAFRRREAALFAQLTGELDARAKAGSTTGTEAFNASIATVEDAARAHTELLFVELFDATVRDVRAKGDVALADMLQMCGALFATAAIERQPAFLRTTAISAKTALRVRAEMQMLCAELRPHVLDLVNSFDIPAHLLAPIAFDYVSHNARSRL